MTATLPDTKIGSLPSQRFSTRHIGPQADDREKMLAALGLTDLEQLVEQSLPRSIRSTEPLALPPALSESETLAVLRDLASRNRPLTSMIGLGYHGTVTPSVIRRNVLESPAWYTAYTPVPARNQPGPARGPAQLPDRDLRSHRRCPRQERACSTRRPPPPRQ